MLGVITNAGLPVHFLPGECTKGFTAVENKLQQHLTRLPGRCTNLIGSLARRFDKVGGGSSQKCTRKLDEKIPSYRRWKVFME